MKFSKSNYSVRCAVCLQQIISLQTDLRKHKNGYMKGCPGKSFTQTECEYFLV